MNIIITLQNNVNEKLLIATDSEINTLTTSWK